jgi:hypothetical protein
MHGLEPQRDTRLGTLLRLQHKRDIWTGPKSGYWINSTATVTNSTLSRGSGWRRFQADSQQTRG